MEFWELRQMKALPLEMKITKSLRRIREWRDHWRGRIYSVYTLGFKDVLEYIGVFYGGGEIS